MDVTPPGGDVDGVYVTIEARHLSALVTAAERWVDRPSLREAIDAARIELGVDEP